MSGFYDDEQEGAVVASKPGTVAVEESRAMSEVKAQVFMARQYPRDVLAARDRIMQECSRLKLAEKATYVFNRGGSAISGPSIRLAEAIGRAWGNLDAGIIEGERNAGESSMIAYAWDLETNTRMRKEFKVKHIRDTKKGPKALTDERDIYEMTANQGARRLRACILSLIPGDIVDEAVKQCERTLTAKVGDLATVIPKMVERFATIGVTKEMIEKRLRHRIEATQAAEVVQLGSIFNSIQDGMAVASDYFDMPSESMQASPARVDEIYRAFDDYMMAEGISEKRIADMKAAMDAGETNLVKLEAILAAVKAEASAS